MAEATPAVANSNRAAVILDVDGVLRVDTETKPQSYVRHPVYPMFSYNPSLRKPLGRLLEAADGYYISLWREQSHEHGGEVLLLPKLDWINDETFGADGGEISERALAIQSLFGERPIAWIDDELSEADIRWAKQREAPTFTVKPQFEVGLTPNDVHRVESWIESLT